MNPAEFSVRNRALVNAAVILILVVGVYALIEIPRELMPRVSFNWAFVFVDYPGATPTEIENLITIPVEDELQAVEDVAAMVSHSRRGRAFVWLEFEQIDDDEFQRHLDDVRARLNRVALPEQAEDPIVSEFSSYDFDPVVSVVVRGTAGERQLKEVADRLQRDLRDIPGVAKVSPFGDREVAVRVDCDPLRLEANRLDITDVETALRLANLNLPGGEIKIGGDQVLVRTRAQFLDADEIAGLTLRAGMNGRRVRLGDVATVSDGFEEREMFSRFDGEPSISLSLTKQETGSTIEIVSRVRAVLDGWRDRLPAGVELDLTADQSIVIDDLLGVLEANALMGLVLVVVALFFFIGWRGAVVAALGIPVTFLIAIIAMHWSGHSFNGNTLFALILVLGMVVDDAVVVLENTFRHLEMGKAVRDAAVDGVRQVISPVIVSSLTTMGGFLPLILMPGITGKYMRIVPIAVSLVLFASLIEALWIMPSHVLDIVERAPARRRPGAAWWERAYLGILERFIARRYAVVGVALLLLAGSALLIPLIGVDMFGGDEISSFFVYVTLPDGIHLDKADQIMRLFERRALELPAAELEGVSSITGLHQKSGEWTRAPHVGQLVVDLVERKDRQRDLAAIIADLRRRTADIAGPVNVEFHQKLVGPPADSPVELLVKGEDLRALQQVAERLEDELADLPGVLDVRNDLALTQRQLDVVVDREAASRRQLEATRIAHAVRAAFGGTVATTFRRGDDEVEVIVRYPEAFRDSLENVTAMRFVNPAGQAVAFTEVARLEESVGPLVVRRHERQRKVSVLANIDKAETDIGAVSRHAFAHFEAIRDAYPGVDVELGGQFKELLEAFNSLAFLFGVGILLNFMLMAGQFKNWSQPLLILTVVPLSFIGAISGLLLTGEPFSITTMYGFVALAGVAVNDSIVLVDFINQARRDGHGQRQSLLEAGRIRLRPILLTSVTTILGLLPMAVGLGGTSASWQPLATTIAAGLTVATLISLLIIPCLQAILDDAATLVPRLRHRQRRTTAAPVREDVRRAA